MPQTCSVLVVDDEPAWRLAVRGPLAERNFAMTEAASGREAVDAIQRRRFDLVLMDVNMPGIGGIEACRRMRAFASRMGVILVTVRGAEDEVVEALEAGADDCISKPFRPKELLARMDAVLRRTHPSLQENPSALPESQAEKGVEYRLCHSSDRLTS